MSPTNSPLSYTRIIIPNKLAELVTDRGDLISDPTFGQLLRCEFKSSGYHHIETPRDKVVAASSHLHQGNAGRYLFSEQRDDKGLYLYLEEVLPTHDYQGSQACRFGFQKHGYDPDDVVVLGSKAGKKKKKTTDQSAFEFPTYHQSFGKFIIPHKEQLTAMTQSFPFLLSGPPGAGKTSVGVAIAKNLYQQLKLNEARTQPDEIVFIIPQSEALTQAIDNELQRFVQDCGAANPIVNIRCMTYKQFVIENSQGVVTNANTVGFLCFAKWAKDCQRLSNAGFSLGDAKDKVKHKRRSIYNEFKVISRLAIHGDVGLDRYLSLASHESLFEVEERKALFLAYQDYQQYLYGEKVKDQDKRYDVNFYQLPKQAEKNPAYVLADEVQQMAPLPIDNLVEVFGRERIGFCMDDMQNVNPGVIPRKAIHEAFYDSKAQQLKINDAQLTHTWRNPKAVVDMLNGVVQLQREFGGGDIDGKHAYSEMSSEKDMTKESNGLRVIANKESRSQLVKLIRKNPEDYRVVVNDAESMKRAKQELGPAAQLYLAVDLGGLEFDNIVLYEPYSSDEFKAIGEYCRNNSRKSDRQTKAHGLKDKETVNANLAIALRRSFVGVSRSTENVMVICASKCRHEQSILEWIIPGLKLTKQNAKEIGEISVGDKQRQVVREHVLDRVVKSLIEAGDEELQENCFTNAKGLMKNRDITIDDLREYIVASKNKPSGKTIESFVAFFNQKPVKRSVVKKRKTSKRHHLHERFLEIQRDRGFAEDSLFKKVVDLICQNKLSEKNVEKFHEQLGSMITQRKWSYHEISEQLLALVRKPGVFDGLDFYKDSDSEILLQLHLAVSNIICAYIAADDISNGGALVLILDSLLMTKDYPRDLVERVLIHYEQIMFEMTNSLTPQVCLNIYTNRALEDGQTLLSRTEEICDEKWAGSFSLRFRELKNHMTSVSPSDDPEISLGYSQLRIKLRSIKSHSSLSNDSLANDIVEFLCQEKIPDDSYSKFYQSIDAKLVNIYADFEIALKQMELLAQKGYEFLLQGLPNCNLPIALHRVLSGIVVKYLEKQNISQLTPDEQLSLVKILHYMPVANEFLEVAPEFYLEYFKEILAAMMQNLPHAVCCELSSMSSSSVKKSTLIGRVNQIVDARPSTAVEQVLMGFKQYVQKPQNPELDLLRSDLRNLGNGLDKTGFVNSLVRIFCRYDLTMEVLKEYAESNLTTIDANNIDGDLSSMCYLMTRINKYLRHRPALAEQEMVIQLNSLILSLACQYVKIMSVNQITHSVEISLSRYLSLLPVTEDFSEKLTAEVGRGVSVLLSIMCSKLSPESCHKIFFEFRGNEKMFSNLEASFCQSHLKAYRTGLNKMKAHIARRSALSTVEYMKQLDNNKGNLSRDIETQLHVLSSGKDKQSKKDRSDSLKDFLGTLEMTDEKLESLFFGQGNLKRLIDITNQTPFSEVIVVISRFVVKTAEQYFKKYPANLKRRIYAENSDVGLTVFHYLLSLGLFRVSKAFAFLHDCVVKLLRFAKSCQDISDSDLHELYSYAEYPATDLLLMAECQGYRSTEQMHEEYETIHRELDYVRQQTGYCTSSSEESSGIAVLGEKILNMRMEQIFYPMNYCANDVRDPKLRVFIESVFLYYLKKKHQDLGCVLGREHLLSPDEAPSDIILLCKHFSVLHPQNIILNKVFDVCARSIVDLCRNNIDGIEVLMRRHDGKYLLEYIFDFPGAEFSIEAMSELLDEVAYACKEFSAETVGVVQVLSNYLNREIKDDFARATIDKLMKLLRFDSVEQAREKIMKVMVRDEKVEEESARAIGDSMRRVGP